MPDKQPDPPTGIEAALAWLRKSHNRTLIACWLGNKWCVRLCEAGGSDHTGYGETEHEVAVEALKQ